MILYISDYYLTTYSARGFHEIGRFQFELTPQYQADGQITYKKWFSYRNSANELYVYATLFMLVTLLTYSLFFMGGAIMCFGTGFKHSRLAKKMKSTVA